MGEPLGGKYQLIYNDPDLILYVLNLPFLTVHLREHISITTSCKGPFNYEKQLSKRVELLTKSIIVLMNLVMRIKITDEKQLPKKVK